MAASVYEAMRTDPANWKLGVVYRCADDPRLVVRQRGPLGWTWNFAHPRVIPAILLAVAVCLAPALAGVWLGVRSRLAFWSLVAAGLGAVVLAAQRLSRDPAQR